MTVDFKTGLKTGFIIYGIGILLTIAVHLIFGFDYPHAPPASIVPLLLTLVVGGHQTDINRP